VRRASLRVRVTDHHATVQAPSRPLTRLRPSRVTAAMPRR
jgi:hypothetical protein